MRRIALLLVIATLLLSVVSCNSNKKQSAVAETAKPDFTFTKEDTTEILTLLNEFTARLEKKDVKGAVEMLNFLNGDSIEPLNPMFQRRQAMTLVYFLGKKYDIERLVLNSNKRNEVKVNITLFEKKEGDSRPNMTAMYFRPVKFEGKWYLTTKDNITDTNSQERQMKD